MLSITEPLPEFFGRFCEILIDRKIFSVGIQNVLPGYGACHTDAAMAEGLNESIVAHVELIRNRLAAIDIQLFGIEDDTIHVENDGVVLFHGGTSLCCDDHAV
jgi:hypothetical protein